jgi:hypothetical protein
MFAAPIAVDPALFIEAFFSRLHLIGAKPTGGKGLYYGLDAISIEIAGCGRELVGMASALYDKWSVNQSQGETAADP